MRLRAIAYTSHIVLPWDRASLGALVTKAAEFNSQAEVTGVLLFDGQRFLQYMEGPEEDWEQPITACAFPPYHSDLIVLSQGQLSRRLVPNWSMHGAWPTRRRCARSSMATGRGFSDPKGVKALPGPQWNTCCPT